MYDFRALNSSVKFKSSMGFNHSAESRFCRNFSHEIVYINRMTFAYNFKIILI